MADVTEIAEVRRNIDELGDEKFDDVYVGSIIDSHGVTAASAILWREKAAGYAKLVNVSEAGSSRNLGDLYKNALAMAEEYEDAAAAGDGGIVSTGGNVRIHTLERD